MRVAPIQHLLSEMGFDKPNDPRSPQPPKESFFFCTEKIDKRACPRVEDEMPSQLERLQLSHESSTMDFWSFVTSVIPRALCLPLEWTIGCKVLWVT